MKKSTTRCSSRVENYVKYRPGYPAAIIDFLKAECGLVPTSVIADIGSGTGKLTEVFLQNGNPVIGIEPNLEMRKAGDKLMKSFPQFTSVDATAEATTLPDKSIDFITAGQAFHWFDRECARREFARILNPAGWLVLVWNDRKTSSSPFLAAYEQLLVTYATEYREVSHKNIDPAMIGSFFGSGGYKRATFPNQQIFDFEGLKGRLLSSSYAPEFGHPNHAPMLTALRKIFDANQNAGKVVLECDTTIYYGHLSN